MYKLVDEVIEKAKAELDKDLRRPMSREIMCDMKICLEVIKEAMELNHHMDMEHKKDYDTNKYEEHDKIYSSRSKGRSMM